MSYTYKKKTPEERKKEIDELTSKIPEQIQQIQNGETFKHYLDVMASFHQYSLNNCLLIAAQAAARGTRVSQVASFTDFKNKFHRNIRKNEHGYKVLCPCTQKVKVEEPIHDENTGNPILDQNGDQVTEEKEKKYTYFRIGTVFDVSQTEQIPGMSVVRLDYMQPLQGEVDHYDDLMQAIKETAPVPIRFDSIQGDANGYYSRDQKEIVIQNNQNNMNFLMTVRTAIHETVHSILHSLPRDELKFADGTTMERGDLEVQAEGTSYCVSKLLGLNTDDYALPYIMGWNYQQPPDRIRKNLEIIKNTSDTIYASLEDKLIQLQSERKQQSQSLTAPELTDKLNEFMIKEYPDLYQNETYPSEMKDHIRVAVRHNQLEFYKNSLSQIVADDSSMNQKEARELLQKMNAYSAEYEEQNQDIKQKKSLKL